MRNRLHTIHVVFNFLGSLLIVLGILLLIPLIPVFLFGEIARGFSTWYCFLIPAGLSFSLGFLLSMVFKRDRINPHQSILICSVSWICFSALGALPFVFGIGASYLDGFFETMSGFTTTGITMFTGLDRMPKSIIFYRALIQWIGGLGILTLFLALLFRKGSSHRLFGAESHKIGVDRPVPGLAGTLKILWGIYSLYTIIILIMLIIAGMPIFDSICHSFTALSTGGYSPYDASIAYYTIAGFPHFRAIEYILILGMILGGINFLVHYRIIKGEIQALWDNMEMRYWWGLIFCFVLIIMVERILKLEPLPNFFRNPQEFWYMFEQGFRTVLFQTTSIITTTGFATRDIGTGYFGHIAKQLFIVMMVIGGCVGSTGGGIKVLRVGILLKLIKREVFLLHSPRNAVSTVIIDNKELDVRELYRIGALLSAWILLLLVGSIITAFFSDYSAIASFSGMASALGNIGPCYIPQDGVIALHPVVKIVYIIGMLAGRLEILPVLLLFNKKAWILY